MKSDGNSHVTVENKIKQYAFSCQFRQRIPGLGRRPLALQLLRPEGDEHDAAARDRHDLGELPGVHARGGPRQRRIIAISAIFMIL